MLGTTPAEGDVDVELATDFRIFFDRLVHPADVHRGNIGVLSGPVALFLSPRFDPVERMILATNEGMLMHPSVLYRIRVSGLRDLDGRMMESTAITFRTGEERGSAPIPPDVTYENVAPIFERCADAGCHGGDSPVLGLDLSSREAVRRTAVGVVAEESRLGLQGERVWHGAPTLMGLARVDVTAGVGRPSRSYLLYKVLGDEHIAGVRMPPSPDPALTRAELVALSSWIQAGAPTD